jgi:hypothetical protein
LFEKGEFTEVELNKIARDIEENFPIIIDQLNKVLMGEKVKAINLKTKRGS